MKQEEIQLQVRGKWGLFIRLPKLAYSHYRIFKRVYSRIESIKSSLRLVKSTFIWRLFRYGN